MTSCSVPGVATGPGPRLRWRCKAGPPVDRPAPAIAQLARWAAMILTAGGGAQRRCRGDRPDRLRRGSAVPARPRPAGPRRGRGAHGRPGHRRPGARPACGAAEVSGTPWALGLLARSLGLSAGPVDAEPFFAEAVTQLGKTPVVPEPARAHLVYGEWLRRQRRRADAREQLRVAHRLFEQMGAAAFAERARLELLVTGERARSRTAPAGPELTPQEARIARLAAGGATSPHPGGLRPRRRGGRPLRGPAG